MTKKAKIIILLSAILLVLVIYLISTSGSVKKTANPGQQVKNQNVALSAESYKIKVKEIFTAYEKLAADNSYTIEKIEELKNELLGIRGLPAQFQKLHLNFILALDRMENYLRSKDAKEKNASQKMADQLKADYSWLNI